MTFAPLDHERTPMNAIVINLAILAVPALTHAAQAAEPAIRPNIVFIMADDHGRQPASCYGSELVRTPNIDRLAREGMRFDQAMACNSICSPSRANLITGKYNHVCGVRKLDAHFDGSQPTFPKLLQQASYQTAMVVTRLPRYAASVACAGSPYRRCCSLAIR